MIRSMTGFAAKSSIMTINDNKVPISLSLKSLNSRYFDVNCKLPYPLNNLETEFVALFKKYLVRGSVTFIIHVGNPNAFKGAIEPSIPTLQNYFSALELIKKKFPVEGTVSITDVLMLPNIFITEEIDIPQEYKESLFTAAHQLVDELIKVQIKEGEALKKDLSERIALIKKEMDAITAAFEILMTTQKQKAHEALKELEQDTSKFAELQKNTLYAILDKMDVHEEIIRFKNHLKTFMLSLESPTLEKGKRIDFILQELSREINTITAKCGDGAISNHAINIKVELEKAREQTQNIV